MFEGYLPNKYLLTVNEQNYYLILPEPIFPEYGAYSSQNNTKIYCSYHFEDNDELQLDCSSGGSYWSPYFSNCESSTCIVYDNDAENNCINGSGWEVCCDECQFESWF